MQNLTEFEARLQHGFTHGLCMSLHSVRVVIFSAVTYGNSTVDCSGGPSLLPFAECAVWR